jgi:hypothetical protein
MSHYRGIFGTPREWAIDIAIVTAVGAFLGLIGPFGSFYGGTLEVRIVYWVVNALIGYTILSVFVRLGVRCASPLDLPIWFSLAISVAVGAVPLTLFSGLFAAWFWPPNHGQMSSLFSQYGSVLELAEPGSFAFYYLAPGDWRGRAHERELASRPDDTPALAKGGGFLDRLPPRLGRELLCLQMEDHYVRAHTANGSDLILTPLKDAIAELGEADGLQVHRSWWVARTAVAEPMTSGRNLCLRLSNGLEVPVSRASIAKLRAAGWLGAG